MAAAAVEPKAKLTGQPEPFHVKGPLSADSLASLLKGLDAQVRLGLTSADAFGLALGPAPIVVSCRDGAVTIDPIDTTLNNGKVSLKPGLDIDATRGIALRFDKGSAIEGAEINDEVSKRVLSYAAPVLNEATHVSGKVNVALDGAEIPLTGPPTRKLSMTGQVVFQDLTFAPGPMATQLLTLTGQPSSPGVKIEQPVQLSIADGRVNQKGLAIPLRGGTKIALEGSVGFDQTLNLVASVPLSSRMLGVRSGAIDQAVSGKSVQVPIDGTVSRPRVNRKALQVALKELSQSLLSRDVSRKASQLLDQLVPPAAAGDGQTGGKATIDAKGLEDAFRQLIRPRGGGSPSTGSDP
jgi:translocation and assembly module TamB